MGTLRITEQRSWRVSMEKKNDRNKNTSQNKLYSDEIKEMERLSEEQEKALRERRQARKHRIKKQE